jgi:hypothetical protein
MSKFELNPDAGSLICSPSRCEMRRSRSTQAQSTASNCRLTSLREEWPRMHANVSSDWLPSYIKSTRPDLDILIMDRKFPDRPHILV